MNTDPASDSLQDHRSVLENGETSIGASQGNARSTDVAWTVVTRRRRGRTKE